LPTIDPHCDFPNLEIPSEDFVCKRIDATIEENSGEFYGIVCKSTGLPDGNGVFRDGNWWHFGGKKLFGAGNWVHCGKFKHGTFQEGRMVSVNIAEKVLQLTNKKCLLDGSVLKKIERFSKQGVEREFFLDGKKIVVISARLTGVKDAQNWLSLQPNPLKWYA
jgi:hypothetical protein